MYAPVPERNFCWRFSSDIRIFVRYSRADTENELDALRSASNLSQNKLNKIYTLYLDASHSIR